MFCFITYKNSYYVTKNLALARKLARKFCAAEVVDIVCTTFSDSKSEREGGGEIYSYLGGTTMEVDLLVKAVTLSLVV